MTFKKTLKKERAEKTCCGPGWSERLVTCVRKLPCHTVWKIIEIGSPVRYGLPLNDRAVAITWETTRPELNIALNILVSSRHFCSRVGHSHFDKIIIYVVYMWKRITGPCLDCKKFQPDE